MTDRLFGIFLMLIAAFIGGYGLTFDVPFSYDPLGPKAFPVILGAVLFLLAIFPVIKPEYIKTGSKSSILKGVFLVVCLVFYQLTFKFLGFLISTTITVYLISRIFKGKTVQSVIVAVVISLSVYVIFDIVLQIPLPLGEAIEKIIG